VSHSGAVYAWGRNDKGQLGLGDTTDKIFPTQVRSLRNQKICFVACGAEHTVCLTEDGGVFSFGSGQYGQLGTIHILQKKILDHFDNFLDHLTHVNIFSKNNCCASVPMGLK